MSYPIGITSSVLPASYQQLISLARQSAYSAFDLALGVFDHQDPILWPRTCDSAERALIRELLEPFQFRSIDATIADLNVASTNPSRRDESVKQGLECIELATEVNATSISLAPGLPTWGHVGSRKEIDRMTAAFAHKTLDLSPNDQLQLTFATTGTSREHMLALLDQINHHRFGLSLDVGAIACSWAGDIDSPDVLTHEVQKWIESFGSRIKTVFVGGVHQRWHDTRLDCCPMELNCCIDYNKVLQSLGASGYQGPIILKIKSSSAERIVGFCNSARSQLLGV